MYSQTEGDVNRLNWSEKKNEESELCTNARNPDKKQ